MISLQYKSFFWQALSAALLYGPALAAVGLIVMLPIEKTPFQYNPEIIFNAKEFSCVMIVLGE